MTLATLLTLAALASPNPPNQLHEWGTFTSVAGEDGRPIEWRPLAGPSDLPSFVYTSTNPGLRTPQRRGKGEMRGTVRMETPVLYFYAQAPLEVSLSVSFKDGMVTEWYPWARSWNGPRVDWGTFKVLPDEHPALEMRDALLALPVAHAEALALQVLGGFSCAEIAGMLGASEGATMTRLTRARQALRRLLAPGGAKERRGGRP